MMWCPPQLDLASKCDKGLNRLLNGKNRRVAVAPIYGLEHLDSCLWVSNKSSLVPVPRAHQVRDGPTNAYKLSISAPLKRSKGKPKWNTIERSRGINDNGCSSTEVSLDRTISKYLDPLLSSLSPGDLNMGSIMLQEVGLDPQQLCPWGTDPKLQSVKVGPVSRCNITRSLKAVTSWCAMSKAEAH